MKKLKLLILIGICMISVNKVSARTIHHSLRVKVVTEESYVEVLDTVFFKEGAIGSFYLNSSLRIYECNMVLHKVQISDADYDRYDLDLNSDEDTLIIKYKGNLTDNKQSFVNNDQGKRRGTKGLIFNGGVYLTGESYWVPYFKDEDLFTFKAVVQAAKDWHFVSQGELVAEEVHGSIKESTYEMLHPSNQVCIVGNKWQKYTQLIEGVKVNVFLIDEDQLLANKYLNVTGKYLKMYARLIGEFPYAKFDVVENFWETG